MGEYDQFISEILKKPELLEKKENFEKIFLVPFHKASLLFARLPKSIFSNMVKHTEILESTNEMFFKSFFLNCKIEDQKYILDNDILLYKIVCSKPNTNKKYIYDLVDSSIKVDLISRFCKTEQIEKGFTKKLIDRLSMDEFIQNLPLLKSILKSYYKLSISEDKDTILDKIQEKYGILREEAIKFYTLAKSGQRELLMLEKIADKETFVIYSRFGLLLKVSLENGTFIFEEEVTYAETLICHIEVKPILRLFQMIIKKEEKISYEKAFVLSIQLYSLVGFDDAKKILDDKFTYVTDASLKRAAELNFICERRKYRLSHPDEFYHHKIQNRIKEGIQKKDISVFKSFTAFKDSSYIKNFISSLEHKIMHVKEEMQEKTLCDILSAEIGKRECLLKLEFTKQYIKNYRKLYPRERDALSFEELYQMFSHISSNLFQFDRAGKSVVDEQLSTFLLGNKKVDNDCLLRLLFNHIDVGMNQSIDQVLNHFSLIKNIVQKSNGNLSLHSLLDVQNICSAVLYHLEPDEKDLSLDTISKILKSHKHCTEPKEQIFKRARELHRKQKGKVCSTIPSTSGSIEGEVEYCVLPFDSDKIITAGIDTGSCLKVGGKGEDFLTYIATSWHSLIVSLYDQREQKVYVCPFIRNGNGLYGNGIDPKPPEARFPYLLKALQQCTLEMIRKTDESEPLSFATITDLNIEEQIKSFSLPTMKIDTYLPIESTFYSDYHKENKQTYVLATKEEAIKPLYYVPSILYYQKREDIYTYIYGQSADHLTDQINSIAYAQISYLNVSEQEQMRRKRNFVPLDVTQFSYIMGNKDWFIAVDFENNILLKLLPNDKRAQIECMQALDMIHKKILEEKELHCGNKRYC